MDLDWLRVEAARQGLPLTEDDLVFIRDKVMQVRAALADCRWPQLEGLEPSYRFEAIRVPQAPRASRAAPDGACLTARGLENGVESSC